MSDERWQRVEETFHQAAELAPEARVAFLDEACAGDESVRREVESLLAHDVEEGQTLAEAVAEAQLEDLSGASVGPYRLTARLGEGGMGVVYRAVRASDFEKLVAVKLVKRGMDTDFILQRFRHERQILAALDHPNIARILDGGATEDGRPYLVMEYVEGTPITEYADLHALEIPARLELFRTICAAVQHAHRHLVVHRDLKPGHILVTAEGAPKLLDFGIAKLLEADAELTAPAQRFLTPECASPEQVRGEPVTTASDVYSLGVLLYQLLTGVPPHQFTTRTLEEITRVICQEEPKRPGTVRPLDRDLDNIVLKAMEKDPARRYASAEQFSDDIGRYLTGRPVAARTATFRYRAAKFVRRHRTASVAAGLLTISLLAGVGATLWQAHIAQIERGRAERRFADVRELANSLIFEVHDAVRSLPGATPTRKLIVDRALRYLDKLARDAAGNRPLQDELADAYERLGDVQGGGNVYGNLGDGAGALASFRKALDIRQARAEAEPQDLPAQRRLAQILQAIATLHMMTSKLDEALAFQRKALALDQAIYQGGRSAGEDAGRLAADFDLLGDLQGGNGPTAGLADAKSALESYRKAIELVESAVKSDPANFKWRSRVASYTLKLGDALRMSGDRPAALAHYRRTLSWLESPEVLKMTSVPVLSARATAHSRIAGMLGAAGDMAGALQHFRASRKIVQPLFAADPKDATLLNVMATTELQIGYTLLRMGKARDGLDGLAQAASLFRQALAADPQNGTLRSQLAQTLVTIGAEWIDAGDLDKALAHHREAEALYQSLVASQPQAAGVRLSAADNLNSIAGILLRQGKPEEARETYRRALGLAEPLATSKDGYEAARETAADACEGLGRAAASQRAWPEARTWFKRSLEIGGSADSAARVRAELTKIPPQP